MGTPTGGSTSDTTTGGTSNGTPTGGSTSNTTTGGSTSDTTTSGSTNDTTTGGAPDNTSTGGNTNDTTSPSQDPTCTCDDLQATIAELRQQLAAFEANLINH